MHSGITLGPMVGELAAYEVWDSLKATTNNEEGCDGTMSHDGFHILDEYRPGRFRVDIPKEE